MRSDATSFGIARVDAAALPLRQGAVYKTAPFFMPLRSLIAAQVE
jgi:hypothetical protein